jgi:thiamine biosynthesis lipoprotein
MIENLDLSFYKVDFKAMGSACEITISAENKDEAFRCIDIAIKEIGRIEDKYSRYKNDSVVSKINSSAGLGWTECDEETEALLDYANKLYEISDGLFDITSGVLRRVWDFNNPSVPEQLDIDNVLKLIGWQKVQRNEKMIMLPESGMEIDFGGFGKEYAVDRAITMLADNNIKHGFVNLGGDLRVLGPKVDGKPWLMGVNDPNDKNSIIATLPINVGALATSGDYQKYFEIDGIRYCHIISPKTGYPVRYWRSVTLLAPLSITSGTYTTIAMLKEAEGLDWIKESNFPYLAIDFNNNIFKKD